MYVCLACGYVYDPEKGLAQTDALRIGVGFACQKVDAIYALPHDIAMDLIVTEEEILSQA